MSFWNFQFSSASMTSQTTEGRYFKDVGTYYTDRFDNFLQFDSIKE